MTALPDALALAATLMPERFRINPDMLWGEDVLVTQVFVWDDWRDMGVLGGEPVTAYGQMYVEAACREECEARGWMWIVERCDFPHLPPYRGCVSGNNGRWRHPRYADTPAHALLLALIAAVGGER